MSSGLDCLECGDFLDMERYWPHGLCRRCEDVYQQERRDEQPDDDDPDAALIDALAKAWNADHEIEAP